MQKAKLELSGFEKFWYYFAVICSFGTYFFIKVMIKKAILDAKNTENE